MPHIIPTGLVISANLARLIEFGFTPVGSWEKSGDGIAFTLHRCADQCNILYAFAADQVLVYIGTSTQELSARMQAYKSPGDSKGTNEANKRRIREQLDRGKRVDILALCPEGPWEYRGVRIDLAAGMEEGLINELAPDWNVTARGPRKRYGVMGGRRGQQLLKLWLDSPLVDKLQALATRKGNPLVVEVTEAIIKHVRQDAVGPPPEEDETPEESREPNRADARDDGTQTQESI